MRNIYIFTWPNVTFIILLVVTQVASDQKITCIWIKKLHS